MSTMKTPKGTVLPLLQLKGKDYLQVAHRLVWFREEHPDWGIETSFDHLGENHAISTAIIKNESGRVIAQASKREDAKHFPDFIEKSQTGAIGRALALCGYGTQFAPDLDEEHRIVDSPMPARNSFKEAAAIVSAATSYADEPATLESAMSYTFNFGKHNNKTVAQVGVQDSIDYITWLINRPDKDGKPHPEKLKLKSILDALIISTEGGHD